MIIDLRKLLSNIGITVFYFILCTIGAHNTDYFFPNLMMAVAFYVANDRIFDTKRSIFSIKNIFYLQFILLGIFVRYAYTLFIPERFGSFLVLRNLTGESGAHLKTAVVISLFIIFYSIAYDATNRITIIPRGSTEIYDKININCWQAKAVYYLFTLVYLLYSFKNIRSATSNDFGKFDNLFNVIGTTARFIAYANVVSYYAEGKSKYLFKGLLFIVPSVLISLLSLYKGPIILEILTLMTIRALYKEKVKIRTIVLMVLVFLIVFPIISMLREIGTSNLSRILNIDSFVSFYSMNDPVRYVTQRMQYYDEAYYVVNLSVDKIDIYRETTGNFFLKLVSGVIPRALWNNKPVVSSGYMVTYVLCELPTSIYTNFTVGLIGEAYSYGSSSMVILTAAFLGSLQKKMDDLVNNSRSCFSLTMYIAVGRILLGLIEGNIVQGMISLLIIWFILKILEFIFRKDDASFLKSIIASEINDYK